MPARMPQGQHLHCRRRRDTIVKVIADLREKHPAYAFEPRVRCQGADAGLDRDDLEGGCDRLAKGVTRCRPILVLPLRRFSDLVGGPIRDPDR